MGEFLVYPPYEKITELNFEEQETFFKRELKTREAEINQKEQKLAERAKHLEPIEKITRHNINQALEIQRSINYALELEREKSASR